MDGATQLDMLALDDSQTRLQLDQGRHRHQDLRAGHQPALPDRHAARHDLAAAAGRLLRRGGLDRGSDAARRALRRRRRSRRLNGQMLAVRAGEVGEVTGDGGTPQLRTIQTRAAADAGLLGRARPAGRSTTSRRSISSAGVTGYEDLNAYGSWSNDRELRPGLGAALGAGRLGALPHRPLVLRAAVGLDLGRRAAVGLRALPLRPLGEPQQPLVLGAAAARRAAGLCAGAGRLRRRHRARRRRSAQQSSAPVGWFPLGPREAYVPSYTTNRDYYQRINRPARVQDQVLNERWQRAERHEPAATRTSSTPR